jgi:hypothetical protein
MSEDRRPLLRALARSSRGRLWDGLSYAAFLAAGLSVPLYAFPVALIFRREVDLAIIFAAIFVLTSLPRLWLEERAPVRAFVAAAAIVPLLALLPPRPLHFSFPLFAGTYAHWMLVILFFAGAASLRVSDEKARLLVGTQITMGVVVSLFALYQVVGISRGWPGTGPYLLPNQREAFRFTRVGGTYFGGGYTRPTSLFLEPAWMGGYLAWVVALGLVWMRRPGASRAQTARRFLAVVLLICAVLASVSWGAYADLAAVLVGTLVVSGRRGRRRLAISILAGAIVVAGIGLLSAPGRAVSEAVERRWRMLLETPTGGPESATAIKDSSWIRVRNAQHTFQLARMRPFCGVGLGQFQRYAGKSATPLEAAARQNPWCGWLASAAEMGILGPAILLAAFGLFLRGRPAGPSEFGPAVPVLLAVAAVQQLHTGSYVDLWWWYPLSLAGLLIAKRKEGPRGPISLDAQATFRGSPRS